jgi:8-oxo-dGTP pyrophosphatase MutT (NUDIX family)
MLQGRINVGFGILVVSMQFTVGALLVDEQGRLLLGLRSADKQSWPSHWDVIGGKVEPGESLEGALVRELQEEIGWSRRIFSSLRSFGNQGLISTATLCITSSW